MKKTFILMLFLVAGVVSLLSASDIYLPLESNARPFVNQGTYKAPLNIVPNLIRDDSFTKGVVGNCLQFFGLNDGIDFPQQTFLPDGTCSISLYFAPAFSQPGVRMTLVFIGCMEENSLCVDIIEKNLYFRHRIGNAPRGTAELVAENLDFSKWHHLAWIMNGKDTIIYLDGKKVFQKPIDFLPGKIAAKRVHIGNSYELVVVHRDRFVGAMDEIRFDFRELTEKEIQEAAVLCRNVPVPQPRPYSIQAKEGQEMKAVMDPERQGVIIDGKFQPFMPYVGGEFLSNCDYSFDTMLNAAQSGMDIFRCSLDGLRDWAGGLWWYDMGKYDFSIVDRWLERIFAINPNAKLLLTLPASPPSWWGYKFPDEQCKDHLGNINHDYFASHSYASKKWLQDLEEAWSVLFAHLKTTPYYSRIIGVVPISGRYGECLRAGYNSQLYKKNFTDYSKPELEAFRAWLKEKYLTMDNMKKAYPYNGKLPDSFEEIQLPTPQQHERPDSSYLADPVHDRLAIDYRFYENDQSAKAMTEVVNILRRIIGKDKVIGFYFGYVMDSSGGNISWASDSGHLSVGRLIKEAQLDFIGAPVSYGTRTLGKVGAAMGAPASLPLNGKLWLDEADIRTSLTGRKADFSGAKDLEESLAVLWRTHGNTMINHAVNWWFPIGGAPSFSHPRIWDAFSKMHKDFERTAALKPKDDRTNSIAIIVDPYSLHFRHFTYNDPVIYNLVSIFRDHMAKAGIKHDYYYSDDLEQIPNDYPVYIFLNSTYVTARQREIIARRFKKNNHLLVWNYGAGAYTHQSYKERLTLGGKNIMDLTGIEVGTLASLTEMNSIPVKEAKIKVPELKLKIKLNPAFFVKDSKAETLSTFTSSELEGKTAVAFKDMGSWRSVYIGTPELPVALIRSLAKLGGAHVYSNAENVVVRAGNGHLMIHSGHEDKVEITLPEKVNKIIDVTTDKVLFTDTMKFTVPIGQNRTVFLRLE